MKSRVRRGDIVYAFPAGKDFLQHGRGEVVAKPDMIYTLEQGREALRSAFQELDSSDCSYSNLADGYLLVRRGNLLDGIDHAFYQMGHVRTVPDVKYFIALVRSREKYRIKVIAVPSNGHVGVGCDGLAFSISPSNSEGNRRMYAVHDSAELALRNYPEIEEISQKYAASLERVGVEPVKHPVVPFEHRKKEK